MIAQMKGKKSRGGKLSGKNSENEWRQKERRGVKVRGKERGEEEKQRGSKGEGMLG